MSQKKDRRSARTRKREQFIGSDFVGVKSWNHQLEWCLNLAGANFSTYPLPSFPRSHSSSSPMVPEASQ